MDNNVAEVDDLDKATSRLFYDNRNQFIRDFQRFMGKKNFMGASSSVHIRVTSLSKLF